MEPVIGILLGDAAGIGPEIVARMFAKEDLRTYCRPIIIGDRRILARGMEIAKVAFPIAQIEEPSQARWTGPIPMINQESLDPAGIPMGQISALAGRETGEMMVYAMGLCTGGQISGFAFGPYHKAAMEYGGYPLLEKGTSFFGRHLNWNKPFGEMNVVRNLWTSRVTSHIPLKEVSENLSVRRIKGSIHLAHSTLKKAGFNNPRLAVAALNPHCGEEGLCGSEEIEIISPAVKEAVSEGINVFGPLSADTLFAEAVNGAYDGVVTLYHDQGQIALKLLDFETVVTVLAGLPYAITTPSHGTAFDIAGKGVARSEAMRQAVIIAAKIASWRETS
ncbi:MAG: 4-hydroxythreonine-4-phosphate dehydrogenase PdxA [Proteobacteria bacterium]|nr:4-hydroxythreonine-4-phosphate dehydrogenase PdxA [Pseudomonadota bacterium]MBU4471112.1 4-hydroxythreonine-4-phosphate dehydrogenase PdxA [Pseudomonadota bacterium]MCG2750235.1 4-hydroxythreonine-4-phosphate dehydrogenase PdxA [Desulfobacteraceae bacterium]